MKRSVLAGVIMLCVIAGAVRATPARGGGQPPPAPGSGRAVLTTAVTQTGDVYQYPTHDAPTVGTLVPGDMVLVLEQVGDWYRIQRAIQAPASAADPPAEGWVTGTLLRPPLDTLPLEPHPSPWPTPHPTQEAQPVNWVADGGAPTPPAEQADPASDPARGTPPSTDGTSDNRNDVTHSPEQQPAGDPSISPPAGDWDTSQPIGRGQDGVTMPASGSSGRAAVPVSIPIIVHQCADSNGNRACDVHEGIAGLTAYVLDARTGQVLGQSVSDTRGIAQIPVTVMSDTELMVNVPYVNETQMVRATDTRVKPVLVEDVAAIPGLLP